MSKMSPNGAVKSSWKNRWWQPTLSLYVLSDQVYAPAETLGLSPGNAEEGTAAVRGWDEPAADRPPSWGTSSHSLAVDPSASRPTARSARPQPGQRSGDGRVVHLHWGEKKQIYVITIVDRFTRCYLGFQVVWQRTQEVIQEMVDEAPKPSATPATLWMPMSACDITGASMKSPKAKRTPIRLKGITLSCAIIWRDWPVARVAFLVARKP